MQTFVLILQTFACIVGLFRILQDEKLNLIYPVMNISENLISSKRLLSPDVMKSIVMILPAAESCMPYQSLQY